MRDRQRTGDARSRAINLNGKKVGSVTFNVAGVTHATLTYQPSVTSLLVLRP